MKAVYKKKILRCMRSVKSCEAASLHQDRKERFKKKQLHG